MKKKMKKIEKINSIFSFARSRLGYMTVFMKIWEKKEIGPFFKTFLTNWGKGKVKMKKFGKISSIIEFSILKSGGMTILMKIWGNFYLRRTYLEMLEGLSWWIYFDVRIWLTTKFETFLLCLQSAGI